jgi:hypothetical protein
MRQKSSIDYNAIHEDPARAYKAREIDSIF